MAEVKADITICQVNKDNIKNLMDEKIIYISPVYLNDRGIYTKIITEKRDVFTERKVDTIIEYICWESIVNRSALKYKTSRILNQKNALPVCINLKLLLVPFKMVIPIGKDSAQGYINYSYIEKVKKCMDGKTEILLGNYGSTEVFTSKSTCLKHFRECNLVVVKLFNYSKLKLVC
jgi:hypothetical protein